MQEFEEANIGGQPQGAPTAPPDQTFQVTTDDLVFMIGEKAIGERQSNKLIAMLQQNLQYLQQELMKLQSVGASEHGELEALRQRLEAAEQRASNAESAKAAMEQAQAGQGASFQARIVALEQQVYQTAQERDKAIRDMVAIEDTVSGLEVDVACRTEERDKAIRDRDAALQSTAAFEERLDQSMSEVKSMRTTFDVLKDESSRLYAEIAILTKERDALRSELDALKSAPETQDAGTWDAPAKPRKGKK